MSWRRFPITQVDAFADRPFAGNPAAVMPLDEWLADDVLQAIAAENNLAETAFLVPDESGEADYELRWFTPGVEVALCGHATLASGHVLLSAAPWRDATMGTRWRCRPIRPRPRRWPTPSRRSAAIRSKRCGTKAAMR